MLDTLMNPINAYADIAGNIGYSIHARNFFSALNTLHPICLVPKGGWPSLPDETFQKMMDRLLTINLNAVAINLDYPDAMFRFGGRKRIGYTVFETEVLSPPAIHQLKQLDQVWVPTQWGRQVLLQSGLAESSVQVVPEGVDTSLFHPNTLPYPELGALNGFRFLSVGKWEARKGVQELLRAFDQAFGPNDSVYLVVYFLSEVRALKGINVRMEIDRMGLKNRDKIIIIETPLAAGADMARLYRSCDAYVSASKAEGWGLPIMEAMASGLPVIAPFYSGPTEYLTPENSYPLPITELEPVYCPIFFQNKGEFGRWAKIDVQALAERMRHLFTHQEEAKQTGLQAAQDVQKNWTWHRAAEQACRHLKEFL